MGNIRYILNLVLSNYKIIYIMQIKLFGRNTRSSENILTLEHQVNKFIIDTTDLEAYWKFDETSGGFKMSPIANIFPDGNSTTETGTFNKTVTGIIGTAWKSPPTGISNRVITQGTPSDYDFFLTGNSTQNLWIKDESCDSNNEGVLGTQNTAGGIGIVNIVQCTNSTTANWSIEYLATAGQHQGISASGSFKAQDGQFHMYTILHDSSDGTPQGMFDFYVDGVFINRNCVFGCGEDLTTGGTFQTPLFWNHPNFNLGMNNATFDEFSFWSRLLSGDEITSLWPVVPMPGSELAAGFQGSGKRSP